CVRESATAALARKPQPRRPDRRLVRSALRRARMPEAEDQALGAPRTRAYMEGRRMDYHYGTKPDEVDDCFRKKRSWSTVKDEILGHYVDCYLKTVQNLQRRIIIVDGFSGPGVFGDDTPGSPLIICKSISQNTKGKVGIGCLFADVRPAHRAALEQNIAAYIKTGMSEPPYSDWSQALARALRNGG